MLPISVKYLCVLFEKIYDEADYYRHLKYWGGCTIALFQLCVWCEKCVAAQHYADIGIQIFISNDRNRVRWVVLRLLQDGPCTDLFENLSKNSLKGDLSNDNIVSPPLFSLVNTWPILRSTCSFILYIFSWLAQAAMRHSEDGLSSLQYR